MALCLNQTLSDERCDIRLHPYPLNGSDREAGVTPGPHRVPKGLRHGYGIHAIRSGIPVTQLQKWIGHAQLSTTAIYVDFVGVAASDLAARMWP